jgi:uncharacterized protein (DUF3084 family)
MPSPEVTALSNAFADLETKVTASTSVKASAALTLNTLGELYRQNADNPAAIRAISDAISNRAGEIDMSSNELAAAIAANTPAANEPEPAQ